MHIRQLEAFRAVMIMGTITRAAEILCVSQPSVSRLISGLEEDLGFELFERKKKRIFPTPEGIQFFSEVKKVYYGIDSLKNAAEIIRKERKNYIQISATPALSISLIPKIIKKYRDRNQETSITLNSRGPKRITDDLLEGKADIAFCNIRAETPGIIQEKLADVDYICALPPKHPLSRKKIIHPEDLNGETLISPDRTHDFFWEKHEKMFRAHDVMIKSSLSSQRSHAIYGMVKENLGIGLLEPFSADIWESLGVVVRPFSPRIRYSYAVSFPSDKIRTKQINQLTEISKKVFKQY